MDKVLNRFGIVKDICNEGRLKRLRKGSGLGASW